MSSKNAEIHHPVSNGHLSSRPTPKVGEREEREKEKQKEEEEEEERRFGGRASRYTDAGVHLVINGFTILEICCEQSSKIRSGVKTKGRSPPLRSRWLLDPLPIPRYARFYDRSATVHRRAAGTAATRYDRERRPPRNQQAGDRVCLAKAIRRRDHRERRRSEGKSREHSGVYAQTGDHLVIRGLDSFFCPTFDERRRRRGSGKQRQ